MVALIEKGRRPGRRPAKDASSEVTSGSPRAATALPAGKPATSLKDRIESNMLLAKNGETINLDSLLFDPDWYQREYIDVAAANIDPVQHYFDNGFREGRNPNRYFDTNWYASNNPDVAAAGLNPFLHYLLYGAREGRQPAP